MIKKLRVFDLDDTLIYTQCKVFVVKNNEIVRKLSTEEYAKYSKQDDESFDFSDFRLLRKAKINPECFESFVKILGSSLRSEKKIAILTARGNEALPAIKRFLVKHVGCEFVKRIEIVTLGSSDPFDKYNWVFDQIAFYQIQDVVFFDDSSRNRDIVSQLKDEFPDRKIFSVDPHPKNDLELKSQLNIGVKYME